VNALDTSVLLRIVVRDDPAQFRLAERVVDQAVEAEQSLFIPVPVLCETVWVLQGRYKQGRDEVAAVIEFLLSSSAFELAYPNEVQYALSLFRRGRAGFTDYLIGALAQQHGCEHTYTFDRKLRGADGFKVI
jgi:predicted nucleic-acid-binding protein